MEVRQSTVWRGSFQRCCSPSAGRESFISMLLWTERPKTRSVTTNFTPTADSKAINPAKPLPSEHSWETFIGIYLPRLLKYNVCFLATIYIMSDNQQALPPHTRGFNKVSQSFMASTAQLCCVLGAWSISFGLSRLSVPDQHCG